MKVLNYTGLQNLWTNIKNYITAHTPTKTSDLTNDSNFVDTSNSAVSSGITSAKVTDYDAHIADTDIHVTTADKTKWNNGVSQAYVFRYSSTALVASSTNSNTLLDNTDNLKVGDKVIDSDGVLFSITAIDSVNSTFTVGSALVDLALDANVVHTSGEESITGTKRFGIVQNFTGYPSIRLYSPTDDVNVLPSAVQQREIRFTDKNNTTISYFAFQHRTDANEPFRTCWRQSRLDGTNNYYSINFNNLGEFYPENNNLIKLGTSTKRWKDCQTNLINGLTPSSLGMPDPTISVDISGYITDLNGTPNLYTPPANGYLSFTFSSGSQVQIYAISGGGLSSKWASGSSAGIIRGFVPVLKNSKMKIVVNATTMDSFVFIPCQGNI